MNTDVYTGADGAMLLSAPQSREGESAQEVLDEHELTAVGRVQDVRVELGEILPDLVGLPFGALIVEHFGDDGTDIGL